MKRTAVVGAGVMGAGIAAQMANAGLEVVLLDIVPGAAAKAVDRLAKTEPAPLMHRRFVKRIGTGDLDEHLARLAECDWIVEAIVEDLDVKRDLYRRVQEVRRPGTPVSSNTSTLPLAELTHGLPESFAADFLITHFFNPPRYMRLVETVAGPATRPETAAAVEATLDRALGKTVVRCKDTPGFVANRIGAFWLQVAVQEAVARKIAVEAADLVLGRPFGIPRTGVFGLLDLVGLDLIPKVAESLASRLPPDDPFHRYAGTPEPIRRMIEQGAIGRKAGAGFFRLDRATREKQVIDLASFEYGPARRPRPQDVGLDGEGLEALLVSKAPAAAYARAVMGRTLAYAASLLGEIADDVASIDAAMRLGYNWRAGPFEMIDRIGPANLAGLLQAEGLDPPPIPERCYRTDGGRVLALHASGEHREVRRPEGVLPIEDVRRVHPAVRETRGASIVDLGDGVLAAVLHAKMNALDADMLGLVDQAVDLVAKEQKALVILGEGEHFSVGVNLGIALFAANAAAWPMLAQAVEQGQRVYGRLRAAPFPVVGAPSGMALGGGLELLLHCDAVVAHAETYAGLPEAGVGIVPAWGGCTRMLERWVSNPRRPGGPMPAVTKVFELIGTAEVARSAEEAKDRLFLRPEDRVVMNRDRVVPAAKQRALELVDGYVPPEPVALALPGRSAALALEGAAADLIRRGRATGYDGVVAGYLARVLSGGDCDITEPIPESHLLALERVATMALLHESRTLDRMTHMLETGRPLRN